MDNLAETNFRVFESRQSSRSRHTVVSAPAIDAIPDGDYGWTVVFACSSTSMVGVDPGDPADRSFLNPSGHGINHFAVLCWLP